jgi:glycosyltransferase involved in cell wall biosynthesis
MKLVIFTPVIKRSAIARMSALVSRALIKLGHNITIVRTEKKIFANHEMYDFGDMPLSWDQNEAVNKVLQNADACVHHIGNCYDFHQGNLNWLTVKSGIICLHDFFVGHLFWAWSEGRRYEAEEVLRRWYGSEVSQTFFNAATPEHSINKFNDSAPLTEWICGMGLGVIIHSNFGAERVLASCPGPVKTVPLAYDVLDIDSVSYPRAHETLQLLTIGHMNPNKRVESVIKAIGTSALLRKKVTYTLAGFIEDKVADEWSLLAKRLGVRLVILGELDDVKLSSVVQRSDVICCLRWPCLEGSSASAIEAMLNAKAVIVTNAGFYQELPDSYVFKVSPQNELFDLNVILEKMVADKQICIEFGMKAEKWAKNTFSEENYAQRLIEMIEEANSAHPSLCAIDFFKQTIGGWSVNPNLLDLNHMIDSLVIFEN